MAKIVYQLLLICYAAGIAIASFFNKKARTWRVGRRHIFTQYRRAKQQAAQKEIVWMHCSSLGEFEQGRPVLEALRKNYPNKFYLLTFFSPSGYEVRKEYAGADAVLYLPLDGIVTSKKIVNIIQPELVVWVKYDYWFYYLNYLKKAGVPVLLISAIFRPTQSFFKSYGGFWRNMLQRFHTVLRKTKNPWHYLRKLV